MRKKGDRQKDRQTNSNFINIDGVHTIYDRLVGLIGTTKMGSMRSKIWEKRTKMGPFWVVVFHENTSKSKFRSKGAELFPPQIF